jgi:hypothetical protein
MMRRLVPFRAEHMAAITDRPDLRAAAPALAAAGGAWTLMGERGPIGAGGLAQLWPGVAEAWVAVRPDLTAGERFSAARAAKRAVRLEAEGRGYWRVQASALAAKARDCRLAEAVGMMAEGVMRRFDKNGADHVRYAWVRA